MRLKIIDLNRHLIDAAHHAGFNAQWDDYFRGAAQTTNPVLMTASNPQWTFGGGIDRIFKERFPELVAQKQTSGGPMERIKNICFCITVDNTLRATKQSVIDALTFAKQHTNDDETLVISGVGTGIGGLAVNDFIDALKEVF